MVIKIITIEFTEKEQKWIKILYFRQLGLSNNRISQKIHVSTHTVQKYLKMDKDSLFEKAGKFMVEIETMIRNDSINLFYVAYNQYPFSLYRKLKCFNKESQKFFEEMDKEIKRYIQIAKWGEIRELSIFPTTTMYKRYYVGKKGNKKQIYRKFVKYNKMNMQYLIDNAEYAAGKYMNKLKETLK